MRDALRTDDGSVPEGYTLTELLILARSTLPAHRAAAMRMLADVLARARPSSTTLPRSSSAPLVPLPPPPPPPLAGGREGGGTTPNKPGIDPDVASSPAPPHRSCYWHEVWQYAVHDLPVAPHIRLALDDDHAPVSSE